MDDIISENWRTQGLPIGNYYASLGNKYAYFYAAQCVNENPADVTPLMIIGCSLQIICLTPHHSVTIYKVSASLDQNCRRSYPETNMLKNLSKGL